MKYRKIIISGVCLCGHKWTDHQCSVVKEPDKIAVIGHYFPNACDFFDCNGGSGRDEHGDVHCMRYVDAEDPSESQLARWTGSRR